MTQGYNIPVPLEGGGYAFVSPAASGDYLPAPSPRTGTPYLPDFWEPWDNFGQNLWQTGVESTGYVIEKLPELLWERGLEEIGLLPKQRVVDEGAGVTVIHTQPAQAGGAPAQPTQQIIPGKIPVYAPAPPKAAVISTTVLIVIGLGLYILTRK
ncbi:hypothetical protein ES705_15386 [subsurface metagenome]